MSVYGNWTTLVVTIFFFFFQAEDGIRDDLVTGVQTCALPIYCFPNNPRTAGPVRPPPDIFIKYLDTFLNQTQCTDLCPLCGWGHNADVKLELDRKSVV